MSIYDRFILILVLSICLTNVTLASGGLNDPRIYLVANVMVYLGVTSFSVRFRPGARKVLSLISLLLFTGFLVVVALRVIEILAGGSRPG